MNGRNVSGVTKISALVSCVVFLSACAVHQNDRGLKAGKTEQPSVVERKSEARLDRPSAAVPLNGLDILIFPQQSGGSPYRVQVDI